MILVEWGSSLVVWYLHLWKSPWPSRASTNRTSFM